MIDSLTKEQEKQLPVYRDKWIKLGLSTEPADRPRAERGVHLLYEALDLPQPKTITWLDSPFAGVLAAGMIASDEGASTETILQNADKQLYKSGYGQHGAAWAAWGEFFRDVVGIEACHRLDGRIELAASCGWWWAFSEVCILTERPKILKLDDAGRLHSEDGPAQQYPDNWGLWAWHGVRVERSVIEEPITLERIASEKNTEVRRVMVGIYGEKRYLTDMGAKLVQRDKFGELYKLDSGVGIALLKVVDSTAGPDGTREVYHRSVPATCSSAHEAVAWTFGLSKKEYHPDQES